MYKFEIGMIDLFEHEDLLRDLVLIYIIERSIIETYI
jgi:hypothetical protein